MITQYTYDGASNKYILCKPDEVCKLTRCKKRAFDIQHTRAIYKTAEWKSYLDECEAAGISNSLARLHYMNSRPIQCVCGVILKKQYYAPHLQDKEHLSWVYKNNGVFSDFDYLDY